MIKRYDDAAEYVAVVEPLLLRDEPRYNLEIAVLGRVEHPEEYGYGTPLLLTVGDGAALMTPPHNLLVSAVPPDAAAALADWLADENVTVPGAMGPVDVVAPFGDRYAARTGRTVRKERDSGVYALTEVIPPRPVAGALRQATDDDLDVVLPWSDAFQAEAGLVEVIREAVLRELRDDRLWLWVDGERVSMVGVGGYTPNGARIGPVWTPPDRRGRGYASAATAAVTQLLLDRGLSHAFLYTDLANPTSNKIYRAIGYQHVTDVRAVRFD